MITSVPSECVNMHRMTLPFQWIVLSKVLIYGGFADLSRIREGES